MLAGKRDFRVSLELTNLYSIVSNIIVCMYMFGAVHTCECTT